MNSTHNTDFFSNETNDLSPSLELGILLKNKRIEKGYSLEKIAEALRLKKNHIEFIEEGHFEKFSQSKIFVRGYIRTYGRLLGFKESDIISYLDLSSLAIKSISKENTLHEINPIELNPHKKSKVPQYTKIFLSIFILIFLLIALGLGWKNYIHHSSSFELKNHSLPAPKINIVPNEPKLEMPTTSNSIPNEEKKESIPEEKSLEKPLENSTIKKSSKQVLDQLNMDNS